MSNFHISVHYAPGPIIYPRFYNIPFGLIRNRFVLGVEIIFFFFFCGKEKTEKSLCDNSHHKIVPSCYMLAYVSVGFTGRYSRQLLSVKIRVLWMRGKINENQPAVVEAAGLVK